MMESLQEAKIQSKGKEEANKVDFINNHPYGSRIVKEMERAKELGCITYELADCVEIIKEVEIQGKNVIISIDFHENHPNKPPSVYVSNLIHPNIYPSETQPDLNISNPVLTKEQRQEWSYYLRTATPGRLLYYTLVDGWSPSLVIENLLMEIIAVLNTPDTTTHVINPDASIYY